MVIATRGRPALLAETVRHTVLNMSRSSSAMLICIDDDDGPTLDSIRLLPKDDRIVVSVKPREDSRGEKYDRALTEAPADVYLPAVDCAPILTPAFDQIIINAARIFPDGIGCVYTPMANQFFPGLQAITARMVQHLGHIYSHDYPFWFVDHELDDIARMVGRYCVCPNIHVASAGLRPAKTIRMRDLAFWASYFDTATLARRTAASQILNAPDFEETEWRKVVMANWFHVVEARTHGIIANLHQNAKAIEAERGESGPPDEGYLRIKALAETKMEGMLAVQKVVRGMDGA